MFSTDSTKRGRRRALGALAAALAAVGIAAVLVASAQVTINVVDVAGNLALT